MARQRKPSTLDWSVCIGLLLLGGGVLGIHLFGRLRGTTPEDELTRVEGVPGEVMRDRVEGRRGDAKEYLKFAVAGFHTHHASDQPNYAAVLAAVESGKPLEVWVSTRRETLFPRQGWVPLYKLRCEGKELVAYADVVAHRSQGSRALLIGGSVLLGIGVWGVWLIWRQQRRYMAAASAARGGASVEAELAGREVSPKRVTRAAIIVSVLIYAIVIGVNIDAKVRDKQVEAFGARPLGLPAVLVVVIVETLLFLPMPWVFWHGMRLTLQAASDRRRMGLIYLLGVGRSHPSLRRSQLVCLGGLLYFVVICAAWIAYAWARGK